MCMYIISTGVNKLLGKCVPLCHMIACHWSHSFYLWVPNHHLRLSEVYFPYMWLVSCNFLFTHIGFYKRFVHREHKLVAEQLNVKQSSRPRLDIGTLDWVIETYCSKQHFPIVSVALAIIGYNQSCPRILRN